MSVNEQEAKEDETDAEDRIKDKSLKKKLRKKGREVLLIGPKMFRRFFLFRLEGFIRYVKIAK